MVADQAGVASLPAGMALSFLSVHYVTLLLVIHPTLQWDDVGQSLRPGTGWVCRPPVEHRLGGVLAV